MNPNASPATFCLDSPAVGPNREVRRVWGAQIEFSGWAFLGGEPTRSELSLEIESNSNGAKLQIRCTHTSRPDVVSYLANSDALNTGFEASWNTSGCAPGVYNVSLVILQKESNLRVEGIAVVELVLHDFEIGARAGLAAKFLRGSGIEIGALQRRLPLPEGCRALYIDRMPLEELVRHYPELSSYPLQTPDIIDDGEKLEKIQDSSQDFVIANHFLEHSRNPIQTLFNLARVLKLGGVLYMAVPDKRYTKDFPRPVTKFEILKQTLLTGKRSKTIELYREWAACWEGATEPGVQAAAEQLQQRDYSIHFNVWTLTGLLEMVFRSVADFTLPFDLTSVVSSENENILILTRT